MTQPDHTLRISASAYRQLLSAASDAGLGSLLSNASVHVDIDEVVITITGREVRALTNWLITVAERHRDAPITATTVPSTVSSPAGTTARIATIHPLPNRLLDRTPGHRVRSLRGAGGGILAPPNKERVMRLMAARVQQFVVALLGDVPSIVVSTPRRMPRDDPHSGRHPAAPDARQGEAAHRTGPLANGRRPLQHMPSAMSISIRTP